MGIHTFEITLPAKRFVDVQNILDALPKNSTHFDIPKDSLIGCSFQNNTFADSGVIIKGQQSHGYRNSIKLMVNPSSLLAGEDTPLGLYTYQQKTYNTIEKELKAILKPLKIKLKDCRCSRIDFTVDVACHSQAELLAYLHVIKKSRYPSTYKLVQFKKNGKGVKDFNEANRHSCEITSRTRSKNGDKKYAPQVALKAYDKCYQLSAAKRLPKGCMDQQILRLELTLKRTAYLRQLKLRKDATLEEILKTASKKADLLVDTFLSKLFPGRGTHVRYEEAKALVLQKAKQRHQAHMLYLLRKASDAANLTNAIEKTKTKFNLSNSQIGTLLKQFDKLGISPITLPNDGAMKELSCTQNLF